MSNALGRGHDLGQGSFLQWSMLGEGSCGQPAPRQYIQQLEDGSSPPRGVQSRPPQLPLCLVFNVNYNKKI